MPFPHKQVLITGATSGIGLALTERLLANNICVIAVARSTARLEALLAKHGPAHLAIEPLDVTDLASLPDWTARITATYPAPGRDAVRVVEIVPPAVQTELHTRQGLAPIGMPLGDFIDEMWVALESGEQDEILVGPAKEHAHIDDAKRHSSSS
ncbi:hypothetical protein VdG1_00513 [Verticillium dahliae VDG1]|nr:hypothetical protein VdG1_00513 [Verticillium dahliae VDG1]